MNNRGRDPAEHRLSKLTAMRPDGYLSERLVGLEKESLRVTPSGAVATTPHPAALGSALTHPHITTDFSEALIEFVTPPRDGIEGALAFLHELHAFAYEHLEPERLWATSMPCQVGRDDDVPIARYGNSNVGRMKHIYRRGLGYRYGRVMQCISGVHFNYSLTGRFWDSYREVLETNDSSGRVESAHYFGLVRNFQRFGWIIPFLFGSSPAVCGSFLGENTDGFVRFDRGTWFQPHATSLRMSDIGYKNNAQAGLEVSYDDLDRYVDSLTHAIETPFAPYEAIGVVVDGDRRQLNSNLLQIENEYYGFIRPKQIAHSGEKPTLALRRRGVQYVEIRALDVSAFDPVGVNESQLRFLEAFLIHCLLLESPRISETEQAEIDDNQRSVAGCGRTPHLKLRSGGRERSLEGWASDLCEAMAAICGTLDHGRPDAPYEASRRHHRELIHDSDHLPSARILEAMRSNQESFFEFATRMSLEHEHDHRSRPLDANRRRELDEVAARSWTAQRELESSDRLSFEAYLKRYSTQRLENEPCA